MFYQKAGWLSDRKERKQANHRPGHNGKRCGLPLGSGGVSVLVRRPRQYFENLITDGGERVPEGMLREDLVPAKP